MEGIIAISVALCILAGVFFIKWSKDSRKKETSDWQVGDLVVISGENNMLKLVGWSKEAFYVELEDVVRKMEWSKFKFNKSSLWRRNHKSCEDYMGTQPGFKPGLKNEVSGKSNVNGKPIELLSEVECQVFLKQALEEENYELAETIKKQMEKYR